MRRKCITFAPKEQMQLFEVLSNGKFNYDFSEKNCCLLTYPNGDVGIGCINIQRGLPPERTVENPIHPRSSFSPRLLLSTL